MLTYPMFLRRRGLQRLAEWLRPALAARLKYSEDQPRDDNGRWTDGGGGSEGISEGGDAPGGGEIDVRAARAAGLTDTEIEHVGQWIAQGTAYDAMRSPSSAEGKAFKALLEKMPVHSGTVYRGMVLTQAQVNKMTETKVISITKMSSSSKSETVAHDFMSNEQESRQDEGRFSGKMVLLELKTTTGRDLHSILMPGMPYTEEQEVVLMPKTKYAITSVKKNAYGYTIKAKQA